MAERGNKNKNNGGFQVLNKKRGQFDIWDERFLEALSIPASIAIENARLHVAELSNQRVAKELEVAARIQQHLLPEKLPVREGLDITAVTIPCLTFGGDFYDVMEMPDGTVLFVIADVSGKGIPAALLVSTLHASLHSYLDLNLPMVELVEKLNTFIYKTSTSEKFITLFLCVYDPRTSTLRSIN